MSARRGDVVIQADADVLRVTFNRPPKRNAITPEMAVKAAAAIRAAETDNLCRCIVLTGADGFFSSGADLATAVPERDRQPLDRYLSPDPVPDLIEVVSRCSIPVVAAVSGWALGAGLGLAAASTFVLADEETAVFGLPEATFGVFPFAMMPHLAGRVGMSKATLLAVTAQQVEARTGLSIGLVDRLLPHATFQRDLEEFVGTLTGRSPAVLRGAACWSRLSPETRISPTDHARALSYLFATASP